MELGATGMGARISFDESKIAEFCRNLIAKLTSLVPPLPSEDEHEHDPA